jgi:hypothetical protein
MSVGLVIAFVIAVIALSVHAMRRTQGPHDVLLLDGGYQLIRVYDLVTHATRYIYLPDKVPGDHMYSFATLGDHLVYPAIKGIRSRSLSSGRDILLGPAWDYRPDDARKSVWLFEYKQSPGGLAEIDRRTKKLTSLLR